jgi:hypothetical protein
MLRRSVKSRATATTGRVEIGKGVVYSKPVIFGWRRHGISRASPSPHAILARNAPVIREQYAAALAAAVRADAEAP